MRASRPPATTGAATRAALLRREQMRRLGLVIEAYRGSDLPIISNYGRAVASYRAFNWENRHTGRRMVPVAGIAGGAGIAPAADIVPAECTGAHIDMPVDHIDSSG